MQYDPTLSEGSRRCGRAGGCEAAVGVEEEVDCDAMDLQEDGEGGGVVSPTPSVGSGGGSVRSDGGGERRESRRGAGYARHEIEGIGGVVKRKLIRRARVGAAVEEWEDEKGVGRFMVREREGGRSWCGWCWRVVAGEGERGEWGI